ncbi:shikimate dehydrogenase [Candidatus Micrarchaeota archaeon]|nr:shikimate dehydrogenase [Candidatus Micrarchaeota archaeon]
MQKICVPITSIKQFKEAQNPADFIELRLDCFPKKELSDLSALGKIESSKKVIATIRPSWELGKFEGGERERLELFKKVIASARIDFVDLEFDSKIIDGLKPFLDEKGIKLILSKHFAHSTPSLSELKKLEGEMIGKGAFACKIVCFANKFSDNLITLSLVKESRTPIVSFCMGEFGIVSRILSPNFGAFFTFASLSEENATASGQVPARELREAYSQLGESAGAEKICLVIGDPIEHSISPQMHNEGYAQAKIGYYYFKQRVTAKLLEDFVKMAKELGVAGFQVTIPHKVSVIRHLDKLDESVKAIGAANTVVVKNGLATGYNTDSAGAINSIKQTIESLHGKNILVIGAGGAARAIVYGLKKEGANVVIANRTSGKAVELAKEFSCATIEFEKVRDCTKIMPVPDVIINATSIGLHAEQTPVEKFPEGSLAFDVVYSPDETKFLKTAGEFGCKTIGGLQMLVLQGAAGFELLTGARALIRVMEKAARNALEEKNQDAGRLEEKNIGGNAGAIGLGEKNIGNNVLAKPFEKNIALIGFMATGKTEAARALAGRLGRKFVDLDELIEKKEGKKIPEIFRENGEKYFRELEKKTLEKACGGNNQVISCGGGIVIDGENRRLLAENTLLVCLTASAKTIFDRVKNDSSRPLLAQGDARKKIRELLKARKPFYEIARIKISTDGFSAEETAERIMQRLTKGVK